VNKDFSLDHSARSRCFRSSMSLIRCWHIPSLAWCIHCIL